MTEVITDDQLLVSAQYKSGTQVSVYDDGFGPLWISRNSIGINGIVRAQSFEDAYGICEDEFFPEADETILDIRAEYGFKVEHKKVIRSGANERYATHADYTDHGRLPVGMFIRWETIETPDPDAWTENACFQEGFGFRPNGPNERDTLNHGIYSKDLNGDCLDELTPELLVRLGIELGLE